MSVDGLDIKETALLIMDYQQLLVDNYISDSEAGLAAVSDVLKKTRAAGIPVIYVTVGFRPGYPEVSDRNMIFSAVKDGERFQLGDVGSAIPEAIAPNSQDTTLVKHRISAFEGTDLAILLRSMGIGTLVLFGITTSGVVLSTVRQAADLDYRLIVIEDLCHDQPDEIHNFLMTNILSRQAQVTSAREYTSSL